jgi:hypothetical protein
MITIEQIKKKLIGLWIFEKNDLNYIETIKPKQQIWSKKYKHKDDVYEDSVIFELENQYAGNGLYRHKYGIRLYIADVASIEPFWNLFLQLIEGHTK